MAVGQGLLILSTPILTRLYSPQDFGLFAIFGAFASIFTIVIALRYEIAIPLEHDDRDAAALVSGAILASLGFTLLLCLPILLWGEAFSALAGVPALAPLLWLLPPCLALWGIGNALSFWSVRQGTFRINGLNRIMHHGVQAAGQLGFGAASLGGAGLIFGYALGYLARSAHFLATLHPADIRLFRRPGLARLKRVLRRHWRYPVFSSSSTLLQTSVNMLPPVLIALLYGPGMAGWYALAQRIVALPSRLVGEAASEAFLGEIRSVDHAGMLRLFKRTAALFAGLGILGLLPLVVAGPWLFAIVFGEAWRETGVIVQLLAPFYLVRFVVTPISQTLNVLERQDLHLAVSALAMLALLASFVAGWWLGLEPYWTIGLFSILSSAAFAFYALVAWRHLQRADWQKLRLAE